MTKDVAGTRHVVERRPTRAETRQKVLDAALQVFGANGIQSSSLDAVAEAGRLSKGAIYSSFSSKSELIGALVRERVLRRTTSGLEAVFASADPDAVATELATAMTSALRGDQVLHRLVAELYSLAAWDPFIAEALRVSRRDACAQGAEIIRRETERLGLSLLMPAEQLMIVLFALSNGFAIEWGIDHDAVPDDLLVSILSRTIFC